MQDRYGKSARQKDAHICLSQELLFSRKYDLESERKSVNGHRLSIGIITSLTSLFCFSLKTSSQPHHNLFTTYSQNTQHTQTIYSVISYTHVSNHFLFSFITLVSISIVIRVQFIWIFVFIKRPVRD